MSLEERIEELENEVKGLNEAFRALRFRREIDQKLEDGIVARVEDRAERALADSPLVKLSKWMLGLSVGIGVAVWLGGTIYGGYKIDSIDDRARAILAQLEESEKSVEQADERVRLILEERVAGVTEASATAIDEVERVRNTTVEQMNATGREAETAIQKEQQTVSERLGVKELPDLRELRAELKLLSTAAECLPLRAIPTIFGSWGYILLGLNLLLLLGSGLVLIRTRRKR